ncbi:MAG: CPBP family intramembrane metalloprotease [Saprospiraceae bacterium]|nr:CPBP family intramembrane metalloprotease [Saprospiraceae bacterium]
MPSNINSFHKLAKSGIETPASYLWTLLCSILIFIFISFVYVKLVSWIGFPNNKNINLLLQLVPFIIWLIIFLPIASYFHKRSVKSLLTAKTKFQFRRMIIVYFIMLLLTGSIDIINHLLGLQEYKLSFDYTQLIPLLLISISFLFLQSASEEIFFRAYILQAISSIPRTNVWFAILISSFLFAGLHLANPENERYGYFIMFLSYVSVAILFSIFTVLSNGLEIAIGLHAANNFYGAVVVNYESSPLQTHSIFHLSTPNVWLIFIETLLLFLILFLIFRKLNWLESIKTLKTNSEYELS